MTKAIISLTVLFVSTLCFADTFTERSGGHTFNGYAIQKKKGQLTQVAVEGKEPDFIDLSKYDIKTNSLGRKNKAFLLSIKTPIELICETQAFEEAIEVLSNQGPMFILIEIDSPGGNIELSKRICDAILKTENCRTIAWLSGGKYRGVFNEAATIALACDKIFISDNASIGSIDANAIKADFKTNLTAKDKSQWFDYTLDIAAKKLRPEIFVKSFFDPELEIIELSDANKTVYKQPANKKEKDKAVKVWKSKGELLNLNSQDAVTVSIADKIYSLRTRLMTEQAGSGALLSIDTRIPRARKLYEQSMAKLKPFLDRIDRLQVNIDNLTTDLNTTNERIRRFNMGMIDSANSNLDNPTSNVNPFDLEPLQVRREQLVADLDNSRRQLIRLYRQAIPLAQKHPDIEPLLANLEKGLNNTQDSLKTSRDSGYRSNY